MSLVALAWSLSGLVALGFDDPVSVTSDTRVRRTLVPVETSTSSSSLSTGLATTSTPAATSTTVSVSSSTRAPVTVTVTVATTTTVEEIQPEPSVEEICPEGLHPDGTGFCVP